MSVYKRLKAALFICLSALLISSCSISGPPAGEETIPKAVPKELGYSAEELLLAAASQKSEITRLYTEKIWDIQTSESNYRESFLKDMKSFFIELKALNMLAEQRGIELDPAESDRLNEAFSEYSAGLAASSGAGIISEDAAYGMFREYALALKTAKVISKEDTAEVSENEARIIRLQRMVLSDKASADEVYSQIAGDGSNFRKLAMKYSTDRQVELELGHSELGAADPEVSALEDNEISGIIEDSGSFYIYRVVKAYDEEATSVRRALIEKERSEDAIRKAYNSILEENALYIEASKLDEMSEKLWNISDIPDFFGKCREALEV